MKFFTSLFIAVSLFQVSVAQAQSHELLCPVNHEPIVSGGPVVEYKGNTFEFCCPGCDLKFEADPKKYLLQAEEEGIVIGRSQFDLVSGKKIKANSTHQYAFQGVLYQFESEANRAEFANLPGLYANMPKQYSLTCPVLGTKLEKTSEASDFIDFEGVRYYFCCMGCSPKFEKDPTAFSQKVMNSLISTEVNKPLTNSDRGHQEIAPTCAGCAGEARIVGANGKILPWTISFRYVGIDDVKSRLRFSIDHMITDNLSVGIERSGSDSSNAATSDIGNGLFDYLRNSDGDSTILPRATWFASPEKKNHPSVTLGFASDRLSTERGQAFFATFGKSIPGIPVSPFVSVKTNSFGRRTVFPFGANIYLPEKWAIQAINDGDYSHILLTKILGTTSVSLLYARTQYWGFVVNYGF